MDHARYSVFDSHGKEGEKWVGFDLDGTLAEYTGWKGLNHIGKPIGLMVLAIKILHNAGKTVKIFTARVADPEDREEAKKHIKAWCEKNLGFVPEITHEKDALMESCFDDRNIQVVPNEGVSVAEIFNDAMDVIKALTDGYSNCKGHLREIERLVSQQKALNSAAL